MEKAKYYLEELNLFKNIKENRNKNIIGPPKKLTKMREVENESNNKINVNSIKQEIRRQLFNMNQEYLRDYLYKEHPFNQYYSKLNKASNIGAIN